MSIPQSASVIAREDLLRVNSVAIENEESSITDRVCLAISNAFQYGFGGAFIGLAFSSVGMFFYTLYIADLYVISAGYSVEFSALAAFKAALIACSWIVAAGFVLGAIYGIGVSIYTDNTRLD